MSALAQFQAMTGVDVSGSDRALDRGEQPGAKLALEACGITLYPQDGSGVTPECEAVVVSTAVESTVADYVAAKEQGIPLVHRAEMLARLAGQYKTIAVGGTSGKSTVVAMIFEILQGAGLNPSVMTGGALVCLERQGHIGNAWFGGSELLVIEADESDGSIIQYAPHVGVVLNLSKDHKEPEEVAGLFEQFRAQTTGAFIVGESENLSPLKEKSTVFGLGEEAEIRGEDLALTSHGSAFRIGTTAFTLPVPGKHNIENALAAIAVCQSLGVSLEAMVTPLALFQGVARRFQSLGVAQGVEVIDDFAHNPVKVQAAIETAQLRGGRVLAVYQPHGFTPTRFLRPDFVAAFSAALRPDDRLWLLEIFYAGGTAQRDFSAADIVADIVVSGKNAEFAATREVLQRRLLEEAQPGDLILIMGARDPSLTEFGRGLVKALEAR
jgi:UDP-N-acetylmuramate-alanine ligase